MNRVELLAKAQLERLFDFVQGPCARTNWSCGQDLFNRWDFMCISKDGRGASGLLVQVSSMPLYNRGRAYREKLEEFPCPLKFKKQYWWYTFIKDSKKKKEFKVKEIK